MSKITSDLKKVVEVIDLIITNQQNDVLIQWEKEKTRLLKRC